VAVPGLDPGINPATHEIKDIDPRDKPGDDDLGAIGPKEVQPCLSRHVVDEDGLAQPLQGHVRDLLEPGAVFD
jgi:hypothetical protein